MMNFEALGKYVRPCSFTFCIITKYTLLINQINQTTTSIIKQAYLQGRMIESWLPREANF